MGTDWCHSVKGFRDFLEHYNGDLLSSHASRSRKPITADVVQVADVNTTLDPITETTEVQRMINSHNVSIQTRKFNNPIPQGRLQIKRTVFYTGYLISPSDTANLLTLIPPALLDFDLKFLANNILITPRPAQQSTLEKVGGLGAKQIWKVTGTAMLESKVWAARVTPIPPSATYYTDSPVPLIVLALRKNAKPIDATRIQNWQPVPGDKQFVFETVVGEKVQLRIEKEISGEMEFLSLFAPNDQRLVAGKRKQGNDGDYGRRDGNRGYGDEDRRQNHQITSYRNNHQDQRRLNRPGNGGSGGGGGGGNNHRNPSTRGGRGGNRGGGGGGAGSGGGRNRVRGGYKSLDDVGNSPRYGQGNGYQNHQPNYDDPPTHNYSVGNGTVLPTFEGGGNNTGLPYGH